MADEVPVGRAVVIGGGAFGTALALVLARKGAHVTVWVRDAAQSALCNQTHENAKYLKGISLPTNVVFTSDIAHAVRRRSIKATTTTVVAPSVQPEGAEDDNDPIADLPLDLIVFAIPTQFLRPFLESHRSTFPVGTILIQSAKGIEVGTLKTPYDIMMEELPGKYGKWIAVLAGPSFAKEIALGQVTNVTVAAPEESIRVKAQTMMSSRAANFRCYASSDVMGCEVAGAVKNVLAIASGAATGLGLGLNARAGLICRGLHEMTLLAKSMGSSGACMSGLAGVGDLLLTCSSDMSRNFTFGFRLAKGETMDDILASVTTVAEGVATARALWQLMQEREVSLPICGQIYEVLYEKKSVLDALKYLQDRPLVEE